MYKGFGTEVLEWMALNDMLYCDVNFAKFSTKRLDGYCTFSESIAQKYPGYILVNH